MITAGFTLIGRGNWSGGETYLRNMLGVISHELAGKVKAKLFLTPAQAEKIGSSMNAFLASPPIVDARVGGFGRGRSVVRALATGSDAEAATIMQAEGVDVVFEPAQFYGNRFPIPVVSWIPDFQHRRLPHLFSRSMWWRRDLGFRLQTSGRRIILLSSDDARRDCETYYPAARGKTAVVRFAIDLDPAPHVARQADVIARYELPERYFYLPNQFWSHKNHAIVIKALAHIAANGGLEKVAPVILTGRTDNPYNPQHFEQLMASAREAGVSSHFRHLGLVPYEDVFGLNAASDALINPSLFEGWSTTVEEAKALGTRMLLSDIGLHREQAPNATFFPTGDSAALASAMLTVSQGPALVRETAEKLRADHAARRQIYADALLDAFQRAAARR
ncbi:glycosyltransferase family 4 protein [Mesorhizobium helmanticense]|uniref:Glycosyl transferase n=1 Tax=Mesorhizobium helmanticense TaxID=1776423 RepID=A0A2T4IWF9_9HYPH|nr:glycosyltransferase family 1 protein [Mesorhizobium helmanticense]PTE09996.1 glycosyl transferase [Mesorhizobium helmanticense]